MPKKKGSKGRPTRYHKDVPRQAGALVVMGYTDEMLADFFGIGIATIYRWKSTHPDFKEATAHAKVVMDGMVVNALYKRAIGYDHVIRTPLMLKGKPLAGEKGQALHTVEKKHYPADVRAQEVWLYNRQPELFKRDPKPVEDDPKNAEELTITFTANEPVKEVTVTRGKPKA